MNTYIIQLHTVCFVVTHKINADTPNTAIRELWKNIHESAKSCITKIEIFDKDYLMEIPGNTVQSIVPTYRDFEQYAATKGASNLDFGDAALHRGSNRMSESSKRSAIKNQFDTDKQLADKRAYLRIEYAQKIKDGEIKEMSYMDKLNETASQNPELESTQAAQRLLQKKSKAKTLLTF